jgi:hypothetical protein
MSLILSGTDGLSDIDGSAATPAIRGTDANTGIFFGTDIIGFSEGGVEAMRIDASGNLGIGGSSPQARVDIRTAALGTALQLSDDTNYGANFIGVSGGLKLAMNGAQTFAIFQSTDERMRIDGSGNLQFNSGYGSAATAYGCRAWVNFNGTGTVAIRGSGNVSSITDNGTGAYTVNFSTAMPDANYCTNATGTHDGGVYVSWGTVANDTPPTTSAVRTDFLNNAGSPTDVSFAQVSIIR